MDDRAKLFSKKIQQETAVLSTDRTVGVLFTSWSFGRMWCPNHSHYGWRRPLGSSSQTTMNGFSISIFEDLSKKDFYSSTA